MSTNTTTSNSPLPVQNLSIQHLSVAPGERVGDTISITAAGVPVTLPAFLINGAHPGPTLGITAGIHGAEYPCVEAALRLGRTLDPAELHGQVIIVPSANPVAFAARSIYISPPDGKNLNRQFPGEHAGTFTQALAHWLFTHIIAPSDFYIDLHGGDMIEALVPFGSTAVTGNDTLDTAAEDMAKAFGIPYIVLPTGTGSGIGGATHIAAAAAGIPALLAEAGGQGILDEESVQVLEGGVRRVMAHLEMSVPVSTPVDPPRKLTAWSWLRSDVTGFYYPTVQVGDEVTEGQVMGKITDAFGMVLQTMEAPQDGVILFLVTSLSITPGDPLLAIAV